jgi:4-aminobutyrate aminotransferase
MLGVRPEKIPVQRREWIGPAPSVRTEIPGPNATALLAPHPKDGTPSYTLGTPVVVRRAMGTVVEDVDGNRFLDFCAGTTAGTPGHAHPRIVAGLESQVGSMAVEGRTLLSPAESQLVERLSAILADVLPYRAIVSGRAEEACSIAAAIADAHRGRRTIVTFNELGHPGAAGMQGPPAVVTLDWPFDTIDLPSFRAQLDRAGVKTPDIAAVVMKPFATTRACDAPNATFTDDLSSFCRDNAILLIFDESVSGMGRTGEWFAFEHLKVKPQIILAATGLGAGSRRRDSRLSGRFAPTPVECRSADCCDPEQGDG